MYTEDLFIQVLCGNGGEKLLLLAEGLLKKHVATHSLHEPEGISYGFGKLSAIPWICICFPNTNFNLMAALLVYISLLEQQDKYGHALEILSGNLGSLLMVEVDKLRIQVL